jgi:hypothetical protein
MIQLHTLLRKSERKIEYYQYHRKESIFTIFSSQANKDLFIKPCKLRATMEDCALMQWAIAAELTEF